MGGLQVLITLIVGYLTVRAVQKKWNPVVLSVLFTALIGLLGLKKYVLEMINSTAQKVNADGFYGITGTGLGLALLTGILAWVLRGKRALFILFLVVTLVLLNIDQTLVEMIVGPISNRVQEAWDWFYPWIKEQFHKI